MDELQGLFPALVVRETDRTAVRQTVEVAGPWGRLEYDRAFGRVQLDWLAPNGWSEWLDGGDSVREATEAGLEHLEQLLRAADEGTVAVPPEARRFGEQLVADLRAALGAVRG